MGEGKEENMTPRTHHFPDDLYEEARDAAWSARVSLSEYIRQALREKLDREKS